MHRKIAYQNTVKCTFHSFNLPINRNNKLIKRKRGFEDYF